MPDRRTLRRIAFQSTLPRRERQSLLRGIRTLITFQSTLPRRERLARCSLMTSRIRFQSTLPRRERQKRPHRFDRLREISIHAPAKGATNPAGPIADMCRFQSTLPRRERHAQGHLVVGAKVDFNPRSREGSDLDTNTIVLPLPVFQSTLPRRERLGHKYHSVTTSSISIHAPAKGATPQVITSILSFKFQSTLPRRERPV